MSSDSGSGPALANLESLILSLPPDTRLPSYRELQQRFRLSPATVQRLLSELSRRGLLVTRPGSGTFTAARRRPRPEADLSWQTPALGSRAGLGPDLERLVDPVPPDAMGLASGFPDERLQPLGLLAGAASRTSGFSRSGCWPRLPPARPGDRRPGAGCRRRACRSCAVFSPTKQAAD